MILLLSFCQRNIKPSCPKIKDLLTPGVLLNRVGVSTSTKPTNEGKKRDKTVKEFSHAVCVYVCVVFTWVSFMSFDSTDKQVTLSVTFINIHIQITLCRGFFNSIPVSHVANETVNNDWCMEEDF